MDNFFYEEFKGTGNAELRLDRRLAEKRVFPAIDIEPSSTRKEELLLAPDELRIVHKLRRALGGHDPAMLLDQLRRTGSNAEFLMGIR